MTSLPAYHTSNINYATHSIAMFAFYARISRSFCPSLSVPPIGSSHRPFVLIAFLVRGGMPVAHLFSIRGRKVLGRNAKRERKEGKRESKRDTGR